MEKARPWLATLKRRLQGTSAENMLTRASTVTDKTDKNPEEAALAASSDPEVVWRVAALRPQIPASGPIGRLMVRPDSPTINMLRHCATCGDPLTDGRRYRCVPCQHAVWLACNASASVEVDQAGAA